MGTTLTVHRPKMPTQAFFIVQRSGSYHANTQGVILDCAHNATNSPKGFAAIVASKYVLAHTVLGSLCLGVPVSCIQTNEAGIQSRQPALFLVGGQRYGVRLRASHKPLGMLHNPRHHFQCNQRCLLYKHQHQCNKLT